MNILILLQCFIFHNIESFSITTSTKYQSIPHSKQQQQQKQYRTTNDKHPSSLFFSPFQQEQLKPKRNRSFNSVHLLLSQNNNNGEDNEQNIVEEQDNNIVDKDNVDPIYILPSITTTFSLIFLILGLLFSSSNRNMVTTREFDVDFYMALDGTLNSNNDGGDLTINPLPPLSPAEQLVGALFGPPTSH